MSGLVTKLLIRWAEGYVEVEDAGAIATYGRIVGFVSLGQVPSAEQATIVGNALLASRSAAEASVSADVEPVGADVPWVDYDVADTIDVPGEDLTPVATRVVALGFTEDEVGAPIYAVELATRHLGHEARFKRWLDRMSRGTLGGGVASASPVASAQEAGGSGPGATSSGTAPSGLVVVFTWKGELGATESDPFRFPRQQAVQEVRIDLTVAGSTDTTITLYANGVSIGTATIDAGETEADVPFSYVFEKGDKLTVAATAIGTGAAGAVVQVQ